jgi:hypothetical protein
MMIAPIRSFREGAFRVSEGGAILNAGMDPLVRENFSTRFVDLVKSSATTLEHGAVADAVLSGSGE